MRQTVTTNIKNSDEIKFVISDKKDYDWSKQKSSGYNLCEKYNVVFSCSDKLNPSLLAEWILKDNLNVRLGVQLHKKLKLK